MSKNDDHYGALDVPPDADRDRIHDAWRFMLVAFHPDRFRDPEQRERAEELTKRANAAWQTLSDESARRRYDLLRKRERERVPAARPAGGRAEASRAEAPTEEPIRRLPCPSCASRCRAPDAGGRIVRLGCPACGENFRAMIGARCIERPKLEKRWRMRYEATFLDESGAVHTVAFRQLPQELALSEGELFSVVFHATNGRPVYAIVHDEHLDVGWKVG